MQAVEEALVVAAALRVRRALPALPVRRVLLAQRAEAQSMPVATAAELPR